MKIEYCRFFKTHKVKIILLRNKKTYLQFVYFLFEMIRADTQKVNT